VVYQRPKERLHKGFVYLDDETVTNSLSAIEAGKIDEVLSKVSQTSRGGFGGSLAAGLGPAKADLKADKSSASELEETVRRTRTRFSIFEAWYETMTSRNGIGKFTGWGPDALRDVEPGDTVEFRGGLELSGLETIVRLYKWYAGMAETKGNVFSQPKEKMPEIRQARNVMNQMMGDSDETMVAAVPEGMSGPPVAMNMKEIWRIGPIGRLEGIYTVVAQVEQVLGAEDEWPAIRMLTDAPITPLELSTLKSVVGNFEDSSKAMGVQVSADDASVKGPALVLSPIAVFR
jgi:hypothetical protein